LNLSNGASDSKCWSVQQHGHSTFEFIEKVEMQTYTEDLSKQGFLMLNSVTLMLRTINCCTPDTKFGVHIQSTTDLVQSNDEQTYEQLIWTQLHPLTSQLTIQGEV